VDPAWPTWTWRGGGGVFAFGASPTITDNLIIHNSALNPGDVDGAQGGGVLAFHGDPLIQNNTIMWNEAAYGAGVVLDYSGGRVCNNLVCLNTGGTQYGGGAFWVIGDWSAPMIFENNTAIGNVSHTTGGALYIWGSHVIARNNIFWGNMQSSGTTIQLNGGSIDLTYSCIEGGYTGAGNISDDPQLADLETCLLQSTSPCIDTGDPDVAFNDPEDPAQPGQAMWPAQGTLRNDMGAYGGPGCGVLTPGTPTAAEEAPVPGQQGSLLRPAYPNPIGPSTTIRFDLPGTSEVRVQVVDATGRLVRQLLDRQFGAGPHTIVWDGTNERGEAVASGVYFCRLVAGERAETRRMTLVR
jgi:hypothetical protein